MKIKEISLVVLLLICGFVVRLYRFDNPIADWHSWRQADTSAVSRNFVKHGFDVLHPRFDDLSNVPSGLENPNGYRFVEFPIYNIAQAGLFLTIGHLTLEEWGRLINILASLVSALAIYLLVKKNISSTAAFFSAFFFLFLPFNIYYSRTILPDISMTTTMLLGIYFFDRWVMVSKLKGLNFILALLFTATAFLLKPYALFFTLPMLAIVISEFQWSFWKKWELWLFAIISIVPLTLWRLWMSHYPEGIPASDWLFNGGNIRFKGAFFYWIFADRLGRLISGYWGLGLVIAGFLLPLKQKKLWFAYSFLASSIIYLTVIARGNVQHDYYQILIIPSIAIFMGIGAQALLSIQTNKLISYSVLGVVIVFSLFFGWYFVRDYFNINNPAMVTAGKAVDQLTPKDAKVIAPYDGDTSFLYQTNRQGWASFEHPLPDMIKMGADYLVLLYHSPKDLDFGKTYKIVSATNDYVLFDLRHHP